MITGGASCRRGTDGRPPIVTKASILGSVVLVAVLAGLFALLPESRGLRGWIAEVRDGDNDWGWDLLSAETQLTYGGGRDAYNADMAAADWAALDLGMPQEVWSHDGFVQVEAEVRSDPTTVPAFLLERGVVHGVCDGREPTAIGVYEDRRPFQSYKFSGGGLSGSQARCNAAFMGAGG